MIAITLRRLVAAAMAFVLCTCDATPARAGIVFSQNFEGSLGALESTSGNFLINNTGIGETINGTRMMGHADEYSDNEYSFYQITGLDLTLVGGPILLTFDFYARFETHFDRFNILVSTGVITPPNGLAETTDASQMKFDDLGDVHHPNLGRFAYDATTAPGGEVGIGQINLTAFAIKKSVNIRFQFGSDFNTHYDGINIDNVQITGEILTPPVPGPSSLVLAFTAVVCLGLFRRLRRPSAA